ncbi:Phage repressor protein C, contains Cro/C1-type HTH and peptisase s24 domains [Mesorhizobium albiziae]|uniref:Phage repressor protein C, contains Cro/C1-type HTH and peptisase s24 domains n=1 Tax=Neomesorhizobium albiziae TaxID=335020 RepID=A0A1I3YDQ7_9HYPH|nr:S24 family peptidase [Mesorhizobium albiziae]SFK29873.1 Phage repressor protein C, contains Cro/C1-type HTH and peptisase s24 domains [Mesorhizobium albiziae]
MLDSNGHGAQRLRERIARRLQETGKKAAAVSRSAGYGPDFIRDFLAGRKGTMNAEAAARIAHELETTVPWLQGDDAALPEPPDPQTARARSVPVFGTAAGSEGGALHIGSDVIEWLPCPPGIEGVRDVYALYVVGSSMEPRFRQGDPVFIAPHRPPRPGDDIVIQIKFDESGSVESWVKELVSIRDDQIVVRQHNPSGEISFDRRQVIEMHRIVPVNELFGL